VANKLTPSPDDDEDGRGARYLRERVETERDRLEQVESTFAPPLVATIESRTREVRGDLLAEVAAALDVDPAPAAEY
jgi:arsenite-transporting ATPase